MWACSKRGACCGLCSKRGVDNEGEQCERGRYGGSVLVCVEMKRGVCRVEGVGKQRGGRQQRDGEGEQSEGIGKRGQGICEMRKVKKVLVIAGLKAEGVLMCKQKLC